MVKISVDSRKATKLTEKHPYTSVVRGNEDIFGALILNPIKSNLSPGSRLLFNMLGFICFDF